MYYIESKGKKYYYRTFDSVKKVCDEIFAKTGIIMGIQKEYIDKPN